jgi:hypothetical protein
VHRELEESCRAFGSSYGEVDEGILGSSSWFLLHLGTFIPCFCSIILWTEIRPIRECPFSAIPPIGEMGMVRSMGSLRFSRFFKPILKVSRESGGSGTATEVIDWVLEKMAIPESEQEATLKSGESVVRNQIRWGRLYLVRAGYLDSSERGIWSLPERGMDKVNCPRPQRRFATKSFTRLLSVAGKLCVGRQRAVIALHD